MKANHILIGLTGLGIGYFLFKPKKEREAFISNVSDSISNIGDVVKDKLDDESESDVEIEEVVGTSKIVDVPMVSPIKTQAEFDNTALSFTTKIEDQTVSFYRDSDKAYKRYFLVATNGLTPPMEISQEEYVKAYNDYKQPPVTLESVILSPAE
jgi:hypothetical protein